MKKLLLLFLLSSHSVRADLVIVEELTIGGKVASKITTSVRKDKARIDYGDRQSAIFNLKSGEYIALVHPHKVYSLTVGSDYLAELALVQKASPLPVAKADGNKEAVDGKICEIFAYKSHGASVRLWVTKEHPAYAKWKAELASIRRLDRQPFVDGMILKSETRQTLSKESTRVVSIKEVKVADSTFLIPDGYKKQDP